MTKLSQDKLKKAIGHAMMCVGALTASAAPVHITTTDGISFLDAVLQQATSPEERHQPSL